MGLQEEINAKVKEISTDGYPMSIGELMNLYRDGELEIHPEFQRIFRWKEVQKTKFIESILLGIPIPAIFVSQRSDGVWDVVDGLQRLSTIFEFVGILKDEEGNKIPPSRLVGTKFLPSLNNKMWNNVDNEEDSFTNEQRIKFKREKLDVKIIKDSNYKEAKYELFQRINTGGAKLTDQEVRNCLLIMIDKNFYDWLEVLRSNVHFKNCIPLSEKQYIEQYDMEIVVRFIVYRHINLQNINGNEDMGEFITETIVYLIENKQIDLEREKEIFERTFEVLDTLLGEDTFKKYDLLSDKFKGAFSLSIFEVLISGISKKIESNGNLGRNSEEIKEIIKGISDLPAFKASATGTRKPRPIIRFKELRMLGESLF